MNYLDLADYLVIAEMVTGIDAVSLSRIERIGLAESALAAPAMGFGDVDFYPDVIDKAAVLCSRLLRNHPLPDGNKRAAYVAMREFLLRNGLDFEAPTVEETVDMIERLAASDVSEADFAAC